jgi:hypothetical protein
MSGHELRMNYTPSDLNPVEHRELFKPMCSRKFNYHSFEHLSCAPSLKKKGDGIER